MEKPGTPSSEQSDKAKKYDRQLRLWGDHGQASLECANICLINASATGTETLKSLVLPGVGAITIVDDAKVTPKDIGNNFFVDGESIGRPRGEVALHLLLELNPDVRGTFVDQAVDEILDNQPDFFSPFTCVIATCLPESTLLSLSKVLWDANIPLLVVRSYGMIGYIRVQIEEHTVIESHPDNEMPDLRLDRPFPALQKYMDSLDLETMDSKEHSHVPYVVILYKTLQQWNQRYGAPPKNYREKKDFIQLVKEGMREKESGEAEENFEEAMKAVNTSLMPTRIPSGVESILNEAASNTLTPSTRPFWIMAKALHEFVTSEGRGALPVRGTIPDMTADSEKYIKIQNLYREQAAQDADWVLRRVLELSQQLGPRKVMITESDVKAFCKNAHALRVLKGKSIAEEYKGSINLGDIGAHLENPESELVWYVMLRAVDQFHSEFRAYPGYFQDQVETDIVRLKVCVNRLLADWGCGPIIKDDFIHEMCRYGAAEVHSIAAYIGGCAAHEAIKIITAQYVPIHNTHIYNAITATSATFTL
ncbi:NEDD8-activating enzyme E1 regulatory subunit [Penaeus vannamei]|uniref:NEDD8-activating enzyme E1 regulatory subunit n=1 Tax=Penaeus vannamei TaxID=6689 RepID=A0A423TJ75_PENVA|nr:NEDD8-activating enzyme E1 regulatory subunit-like [Penaeus vannamei]ROT76495.1 NEDD8-activating enzyme E1 regulatory subunit [Penaeus vannamei]